MRRARRYEHALLAMALAAAGASCQRKAAAPTVDTAPVTRQDIVVNVEATGVIEPAVTVQVKSKASGQIVKMPVQVGTSVKPGDLLVQIDPRDVKSRYDQAVAALRSAQDNARVTRDQYQRAEELFKSGVITAPERETALVAYSNAQSNVVTAQANLEVARINLNDATVRAPSAGTVIDKSVAEGQVISSATSNVGGGTTLLTIANLDNLVDSTLVNESDIGKIAEGQVATLTVDAYPNRTFQGVVQHVFPQATIQQSVTMFPVLIAIDNRAGLLKPGMNSDVSILIERRTDALAIPNDAIGSAQSATGDAVALGLDPTAVRQALQQQGGQSAVGRAGTTARPSGGRSGRGGRTASAGGDVAMRAGAGVAGAGRTGGAARAEGTTPDDGLPVAAGAARDPSARAAGRSTAVGRDTSGGARGTLELDRPRRGVVFVKQGTTFTPRLVLLGVGNYDQTEVLSGLQSGEQVALITDARLRASHDSTLTRIRSRAGIPGMSGGGAGGGGARGGGGSRGG